MIIPFFLLNQKNAFRLIARFVKSYPLFSWPKKRLAKTIKAAIFEVMATLSSSGESVVIFFIITPTACLPCLALWLIF